MESFFNEERTETNRVFGTFMLSNKNREDFRENENFKFILRVKMNKFAAFLFPFATMAFNLVYFLLSIYRHSP
jgi:hypothetical protein